MEIEFQLRMKDSLASVSFVLRTKELIPQVTFGQAYMSLISKIYSADKNSEEFSCHCFCISGK